MDVEFIKNWIHTNRKGLLVGAAAALLIRSLLK